MKYDILFSLIFYVCGCFYMVFGAFIIAANVNSKAHQLYLCLTSSLAIWSLAYSIANSVNTAEESAFWKGISVFGWGVFWSILLHLMLILTENEDLLNKKSLLGIYLPAFINVVTFAPFGFLTEKLYKMVPTDFGWTNTAFLAIPAIWISLYYSIFSIASIVLLVRWWKKIEAHTPLKRQITYFLLSIFFPIVMGAATDILPEVLGKKTLPELGIVFFMLPTITLFLTLKTFGLLLEKEKTPVLFQESRESLDESRLRLFQTAAAIFIVGAAAIFATGYFGMKKDLKTELLLTSIIIIVGIITRFIPFITKKHTTQNTLFLVICVLGMLFFMLVNLNTSATTIWAIYIMFLLFTIVLGSKIHAFAFILITVVIQLGFWIIQPKAFITIDGNEYLRRIFIIVLSYFAVRYLTDEYSLKMQGYKKFAEEQEVLEKISSNFISVNNENTREKIDEMFEMSLKILDFNHAYLIELDSDHEEATILNTYVSDVTVESFPFRPGMKVETASLPFVRPLAIWKQPILREDVTKCKGPGDISDAEREKNKSFFLSRGVNSFFALPIMTDKELGGALVIEYYKVIDVKSSENHLRFLKIVANILGDAKKKSMYEERLYRSAYFDNVTKLPNRFMFKKRLEQLLYNMKEPERLAVLLVEIDNLRAIIDTFGHGTGEQMMKKSATILQNLLKEHCEIARSGEGKFTIAIPFRESTEQITECANKIIDAFSEPILTEEGIEALFAVVNIGISLYPNDGRDADALLMNADLAGYEVKASDNRIVFCTDQMKSRVEENTLLTNKIFRALQNEEFSLEFQPQVSCSTGKTVGIEALLRWTLDDNKRVSPEKFIPILEQTGLIHDVGLWVLEQALKEHERLIEKGFPPLRVSINLSIAQLQKKGFVDTVSKIIEKHQVNPQYIELEITESMLSKNFADSIEKLHQLKDLGVNIAVDDFGKGYSSLHRLELVPFDRLKIDKSIIDNITFERKKAAISEAIVALAKSLQVHITAEGVETKEQAGLLKELACDEIQGYYFSKPLPGEALEEYLKKMNDLNDL